MEDIEHSDAECCDDPCIESKNGSNVCSNCGTIKSRTLVGEEKRTYTVEEVNKKKTNEPIWRSTGPRTLIPISKFYPNNLKINDKALFSRLSKIQNSLISSIERNFWEAKPMMKRLTSKLNIPKYIKETAWKIYALAAKKRLTMGRSIIGFVAAALYAAIRIHEFSRLLDEICEVDMIPRRTVHRSLGIIVKDILPELNLKYKPITAEQLIYKFGNDLALPFKAQREARELLSIAFKKGMRTVGKDPKGVAASAIYLAAKKTDYSKTQIEVSKIARITEVTLRTRTKEIKENL